MEGIKQDKWALSGIWASFLRNSVGDPDPHVFGPSVSGSISQTYGFGSFPFLKKGVERTEICNACKIKTKLIFN